jgi:hypothetical protein
MMTHAQVHVAVRGLLRGTTLDSFMVTTNSWEHDDHTVAVEWSVCVHRGANPVLYFRAREPERLVEYVRAALEERRAEFAEPLGLLAEVDAAPPEQTHG